MHSYVHVCYSLARILVREVKKYPKLVQGIKLVQLALHALLPFSLFHVNKFFNENVLVYLRWDFDCVLSSVPR